MRLVVWDFCPLIQILLHTVISIMSPVSALMFRQLNPCTKQSLIVFTFLACLFGICNRRISQPESPQGVEKRQSSAEGQRGRVRNRRALSLVHVGWPTKEGKGISARTKIPAQERRAGCSALRRDMAWSGVACSALHAPIVVPAAVWPKHGLLPASWQLPQVPDHLYHHPKTSQGAP